MAVAGFVLAIAALLFAWLTFSRDVPPLHADRSDKTANWIVYHPGPKPLRVIEAYVLDEDQKRQRLGQWVDEVEKSEMRHAGMLIADDENPWFNGWALQPHVRYQVEPGSAGRTVVIKYRRPGVLLWPTASFTPPWEG